MSENAATLIHKDFISGSSSRIKYIDVLRGIALLGILLMNIPDFGLSTFFSSYTPERDGTSGANYETWLWGAVFFDGKMRGIFTLLFGAGMMLFMQKESSGENSLPRADAYFRRMLWLLFFGLVDSYLFLWLGDVLYEYAICGMLLFAFRRMNPRGLIIISVLILSLMSYLACGGFNDNKERRENYIQTEQLLKEGKKLNNEQIEKRKEWFNTCSYSYPYSKEVREERKKNSSEEIKIARSGYFDVFEKIMPMANDSHSVGLFYGCWETFATIMLGMALFKLGIFSGKLKKKVYVWLMIAGLGIGLPLAYWVTISDIISRNYFLFYIEHRWMSVMPFEQISRVFVTLGYVGLFMFIGVSGWMKGFQNVMACVGRMAFTNYLMQSLICTFIFFGYGFGMFEKLQRYQLLYVVGGVWIFQIIFSVVWLKFFTLGPLEWLWRSLIYWKKLPIKIK